MKIKLKVIHCRKKCKLKLETNKVLAF